MQQKSRAEYYRQRRKIRKQFSILTDRELVEALEKKLTAQGKTKTLWFREKAAEELGRAENMGSGAAEKGD